jgi:hypothetical protein
VLKIRTGLTPFSAAFIWQEDFRVAIISLSEGDDRKRFKKGMEMDRMRFLIPEEEYSKEA